MNMMQQDNFKKIKDFVKQQIITDDTVVIRPIGQGFKVNRYTIQEEQESWAVYDQHNDKVQEFFSRKYAVLAAVLLSKNRRGDILTLKAMDQQLSIASNDQIHYERLLQKKCSDQAESIYVARLSKAKQILETVRSQIKELEKSLQLQ